MAKFAFVSNLDFNLLRFRLPVMQALVKAGHEVHALCPEGKLTDQFAAHGIAFHPYSLQRSSRNPLRELATVWELQRVLKKLRPDLVHTFTPKPNVYGPLAARLAGVKHVVSSVTGLGNSFGPFTRSLYRLSLGRCDRVIFQNPDNLATLRGYAVVTEPQARLVLGSGIDTTQYAPPTPTEKSIIRRQLGIDENTVVVGMVARIIHDKGIREYVQAAAELRAALGERVVFLQIGRSDGGNASSASAIEFETWEKAANVRFLGQRSDVALLLRALDIFCLPSYGEGMPMSVLEAMASGLPIVTTATPGCRETVVMGANGLLVPPRDPRALSAALRTLIENHSLRVSMSTESRRRAVHVFTHTKVVKQHLDLYRELLGTGLGLLSSQTAA